MSLPYYKRYPRDFFEGTIGMSFEVKAAYGLVLDLIYKTDGNLKDDPRYISGMLGCSVRKWNQIRNALIEAGKITVENEIISNFRADNLMIERRTLQDKKRENRSNPNKNSGVEKRPSTYARVKPEPEPEIASNEAIQRASVESVDELTEAFEAYQAIARKQKQQHGKSIWPEVKSFNTKRRKHLKARLDEHGLSAWGDVLRKAAVSDFCCGRSNDFVASFDFLISPSGFLKTLEGNYDNRNRATSRKASGHTKPDRDGGIVDQFERFAEQMEADRAGSAHDAGYDARSDTGVIIDAEPIASTG